MSSETLTMAHPAAPGRRGLAAAPVAALVAAPATAASSPAAPHADHAGEGEGAARSGAAAWAAWAAWAASTSAPATWGARAAQAVLRPLAGLLLLGLLWHVGVLLLAQRLPLAAQLAPAEALRQLAHLVQDSAFHGHVLASLRRVAIGLGAALAVGVPLGLLLGRSRLAEQLSGGAFQLLRMISPLSWMPVVVMVLGVGDAPIHFLLAFAAVWPLVLNTAAGVKAVSPAWLQLGASLAATRGETLRRIVLPAVLGHILAGLRLAIGVVWIVLVPCEMLGVSEGLGYFILDTRDRLAYGELMAAIVFIGLLGWALDALARALHRRWARG